MALIPPIIEPVIVKLLNIHFNWLYWTGSGTPPTQCSTPLFRRHSVYVWMSWCIETVSIIKWHFMRYWAVDSGSDVIHTSWAPFFKHVFSLSFDLVNATTVWPIERANLIPIVPKPPIPTIPITFFLPSMHPWLISGDHIVTPAHKIGAIFDSGISAEISGILIAYSSCTT